VKELNCLYLEHDERDYWFFSEIIGDAMEGWAHLKFERVSDPQAAHTRIKEDQGSIDIFLTDLWIDHERKSQGLVPMKPVQTAVAKKTIAVIGLSKSDSAEDRETFQQKWKGNALINKTKAQEWSNEDWRERIHAILQERGKSLYAFEMDWTPGLLPLDAEIETVGADNFRHLVMKLVPIEASGATGFTPRYVARGRSGAVTIRADIRSPKSVQAASLLVKISREGSKLKRELDNARTIMPPLPSLYIKYLPTLTEPVRLSQDNWQAIASTFEADSTTLYEWLADDEAPRPAGVVDTVVRGLFIGGLSQDYGHSEPCKKKSPHDLLQVSKGRQARILGALGELQRPLSRLCPSVDLERLRMFVTGQALERKPLDLLALGDELPRGVHRCWSHGDLHSRNILVSKGNAPRAWLIDAGNREPLHWAKDPARLAADLWITAWDREEAFYWGQDGEPFSGNVARWKRTMLDWFDSRVPTATPEDPVLVALQCLLRILPDVFEVEYDKWQLGLALVMDLLAHGSYDDIPAPKRCLAFAVADELIVRLERDFPERGAVTPAYANALRPT